MIINGDMQGSNMRHSLLNEEDIAKESYSMAVWEVFASNM